MLSPAESEDARILSSSRLRHLREYTVGFVDDNDVRDLDDALRWGGNGRIVSHGVACMSSCGKAIYALRHAVMPRPSYLFRALQLVAAAGWEHEHNDVDDLLDGEFRLTDAYCFDDDDIISGTVKQLQRIIRVTREPAEHPSSRRRSNKRRCIVCEPLHSSFVTEN